MGPIRAPHQIKVQSRGGEGIFIQCERNGDAGVLSNHAAEWEEGAKSGLLGVGQTNIHRDDYGRHGSVSPAGGYAPGINP